MVCQAPELTMCRKLQMEKGSGSIISRGIYTHSTHEIEYHAPATFSMNLALSAADDGRRQADPWRSFSSASSLASLCRSPSTFASSSIATLRNPCSSPIC